MKAVCWHGKHDVRVDDVGVVGLAPPGARDREDQADGDDEAHGGRVPGAEKAGF